MASSDPGGRTLRRVGIVGTAIAALCCFTPVLIVLLGAVGLASIVGQLDLVLFPALGFFVALTIYALWRRQRPVDAQSRGEPH